MKELETEKEIQHSPESEDGGRMSFLEHLEDLRKRLINVVYYLLGGFVICWIFNQKIFALINRPVMKVLSGLAKVTSQRQEIIATSPTEGFTLTMKVCLVAALFLASPFILFEIWRFIAPGLYQREKKYALPFVLSSLVLFFTGVIIAYTIVMPPALDFLLRWNTQQLGASNQIKISEYFDLALTIVLGFGVMFEMPVVVAFLAIFGLVTAGFLWRNTKYAILIIFVAAAVISPTGDIFNQCIYAAPMLILYMVSIVVAAICSRQHRALKKPS